MEKIGPYRIVDGPFQGGFGEVYRVFDTDSGDEFALKTLKNAFLSTSRSVERFRREIELWMRIPVHPNVVRTIRAFDHGDRPYVLIEWISGGNLAERMGELRPRDPALRSLTGTTDALEVLRQICDGMAHIHRQGLVHSDLKPSNIMMWAGKSPQITDFGFARMTDQADGCLMGGTERYMAPELEGIPTVASDIFAAGVSFLEVLESYADGEFGVQEGRELARSMSNDNPAHRPRSFSEIEQRLAAILARAPIPPGIPRRGGKRLTWDEQHVAPALQHRDRFNRAMSDLAAGRRLQAKTQLESIVAEKPDMVDARIALADLLFRDGDQDGAIAQARGAWLAGPESAQRRLTVASLLAELKLDDEAEQALATIENERDVKSGVWELRARMAMRYGDVNDAIDLFRRALAEGGGPRTRLAMAGALREAGLIDQAIAEYNQVGTADPQLALKVALLLARLYVDLKQYEKALRALRDALKRDLGKETDAYVYSELGYVYKSQGLFEAALASYRKSLELQPGSQAVLDGIQLVEEELDQRGSREN